jgi:Uma2 family endonuclease
MTEVVETHLDMQALAARWRELAADPSSPDFFELNEYGEVILSPSPSNKHELIAFRIARALEQQLGPEAATAISVLTDRGVRRPDAVWMPPGRWAASRYESPLPFAPDICVEVLSPGNTEAQMQMKVGAYLRSGAHEVVVVGLRGEVRFFGADDVRESAYSLTLALPPELF